jgi:hypothetical protein
MHHGISSMCELLRMSTPMVNLSSYLMEIIGDLDDVIPSEGLLLCVMLL